MKYIFIFATLLCINIALGAKRFKQPNNGVITFDEGVIPKTQAQLNPGRCEQNVQFFAVGQTATIDSPGFPFNYPPNVDCLYTVSSPPNTRIHLNCQEFNIEESRGCSFDVFRFSLSGDLSPSNPDRKYSCGRGAIQQTSIGNRLAFSLHTDDSNPRSTYPYRFRCAVTVVATEVQPTPPPENDCNCGTKGDQETRIVGGKDADKGAYPWRCSLFCERLGAFCGCTIIDKNWILTAAHCTNALTPEDKLMVNVGDHDLSRGDEAASEQLGVRRIVQNEAYDSVSQDSDTALVQLERSLTFKKNIQPACLPYKFSNHSFSGVYVMASGWGLDSYGGNQKAVLQEVELPVLETEECRIKGDYDDLITDNMFCTYKDGADTCQGDSGGAIDYFDPDNKRGYVVGIVSWGIGCATKDKPGVYAKVTHFLNWIEKSTASTSAKYCKV